MMMKRLAEFLDANGVHYSLISHPPSFTAQDTAHTAHISGKELAKTVVVWMDGEMVLVVLPASHMINFTQLREFSKSENIELATEGEFKNRFPECEVGAMPPFGNLFGMRVFVASPLAEDMEIAFNAGSHRELVKMTYKDFERLVKPAVGSFAFRKSAPANEEMLGGV
jgi:Ala-tRNA(Pro) deacylase